MEIVAFSKLLIVFFVGSVTFWYVLTPYLVQPHPGIADDIFSKTVLSKSSAFVSGKNSVDPRSIQIENWTKWRLFINSTSGKDAQVVYGNSAANIILEGDETIMNMEWRSDYHIHITSTAKDGLSVRQLAPASAASSYGIYNHFYTSIEGSNTVKVVPRFLFGLPYETVDKMYGVDVDLYPIVGVFTESPKYDRIIIQAYMNIVTLSVIFLLWANNPPSVISKTVKKD